MILKLKEDFLDFSYYVDIHEVRLTTNLIRYIELKKDTIPMKGYVEVINSCFECGYSVKQPPGSFADEVHPCDIWRLSILSDEEEDGIDKDWKEIMGVDSDWTQEEIRVYRCCNCDKWMIDNDC